MSFFTFENRRIYYEETGSGAPLLLLHGNTASSRMLAEAAARYSRDFRVVLLDFLGNGRSERLNEFPTDLWFYESGQAIAFLREKGYRDVSLIGSSGGAIAAINAALEAPELVRRVVADSFEGERADRRFTEKLVKEREAAKADPRTGGFYERMHGPDWERVVDCDTAAVVRHAAEIIDFFHRPLSALKADILLTASREDPFLCGESGDRLEEVYRGMLERIGHGKAHFFEHGGHPAMLSNPDAFYALSMEFLK